VPEPSNELMAVKSGLEVFRLSLRDLDYNLKLFETLSGTVEYLYPINKDRNSELTSKINKDIFSTSCAAKALYEYSKKLSNILKENDFETEIEKFKKPDQSFIFKLRDNLNHETWIDADWKIENSNLHRRGCFFLKKSKLIKFGNWNSNSSEFIQSADEDINVRTLFFNYAIRLEEFYSWYFNALEKSQPIEVKDYQRSRDILKRFNLRQWYSLKFDILLQRKDIDPYDHLHKYFNGVQIKNIMELPKHSAKQVNLIISLVDEHNICDSELRNKIYRIFRVNDA
jgi:hypothetical protein